MFISLYDSKKKQDVHLEVSVEYATPCPNLLLVLFSQSQVQELKDGRESEIYDEYAFKPLHHLAGVKFKYEGKPYALTLAFFLETTDFLAIVIDQANAREEPRFYTAQSAFGFEEYLLINTQEYEWLQKLGLTKLSLTQFVSKALETDEFNPWTRTFYDIELRNPEKLHDPFDVQTLVDEQQFEDFIDNQQP